MLPISISYRNKTSTVDCIAVVRKSVELGLHIKHGLYWSCLFLDNVLCRPLIPDVIEVCFAVPAATPILTGTHDSQLIELRAKNAASEERRIAYS
jgi:hypothetical protein